MLHRIGLCAIAALVWPKESKETETDSLMNFFGPIQCHFSDAFFSLSPTTRNDLRRGLISFTVVPSGATLPAAIVSDGVAPGVTVPVVCLEKNEIGPLIGETCFSIPKEKSCLCTTSDTKINKMHLPKLNCKDNKR